MRSHKSINSD